MNWFERLCRYSGLAVHHVMHPSDVPDKQELKRTVEEQKLSDSVTLRRTTIEEVEITRTPGTPGTPEQRHAP